MLFLNKYKTSRVYGCPQIRSSLVFSLPEHVLRHRHSAFSYTALLPGTREAFVWSASFASLLGSANLLGYLMGAFAAMRLPQDRSMSTYIQLAAIAGMVSLFCCAFSGFSEIWYISWRVISGISGGLLMILSPSVVAQCCDLKDRFKINFIGFSGIGLGFY